MKIVSWNANTAFRNKKQHVLSFDPDVLLIQECEHPEHNGTWTEFTDWEWVGENKNKGIGVYTRNGYTLERIPVEVPARYFLPVKIYEDSEQVLKLVNVWAMNNTTQREKRYIGQVWTALQHYDFIDQDTVVAGDINWNIKWDSSPKYELAGNYRDVIDELHDRGLCSVYHELSGDDYGNESKPTFFMYRKEDQPFHTDHCFFPTTLVDSIAEFAIGEYTEWSAHSDHMPLTIDFIY